MSELGRISGQMLSANLERLGVDLAFETDQLYLDISAKGVGVNTDAFSRRLEVNGTTQTQFLLTARSDVNGLTIENNSVSSLSGPIYISAGGGQSGTILFDRNETAGLFFDGNVIGSKILNTNIELDPSGTGNILVLDNVQSYANIHVSGNIEIDGNFGFNGELVVGDNVADTVTINTEFTQSLLPYTDNLYRLGSPAKAWNSTFFADDAQLTFGDLRISGTVIETTVSNSNLELYGNSTGGVLVESIRFADNIITAVGGTIAVASPTVFDQTNAVVFPSGTTANRPALVQGDLRYNTDLDSFEGFTTAKIQFNAVADADGNTRITAARPRSINNNVLQFFNNAALTASIAVTATTFNTLQINSTLQFATNVITTVQNNLDINLLTNGSGNLNIENIRFNNDTITSATDNIIFDATNNGYFYFQGSNALVIPHGPTIVSIPANIQLGDFRFNTDTDQFEIYNGVFYDQITGSGQTITELQMDEITDIFSLILG